MRRTYVHKAYDDGDASPAEIVPLLQSLLNPLSVTDVGCGIGHWLLEFNKRGVKDVFGINGPHLNKELFLLPLENLLQVNLEKPFEVNRTFDLAICLEVAEHISEKNADLFLQSLTKLSHTVLFSAAIPGQGGQNHINEQWPSYWQEKFRILGFQFYDIIRPEIWWNQKIEPYYRQNIFLESSKALTNQPPLKVIDSIHPDFLLKKEAKYITGTYGLKSTFKAWKKSKVSK